MATVIGQGVCVEISEKRDFLSTGYFLLCVCEREREPRLIEGEFKHLTQLSAVVLSGSSKGKIKKKKKKYKLQKVISLVSMSLEFIL